MCIMLMQLIHKLRVPRAKRALQEILEINAELHLALGNTSDPRLIKLIGDLDWVLLNYSQGREPTRQRQMQW